MVKAVIFDVDGVITNSEGLHFTAHQQVFKSKGYSLGEEEKNFFVGKPDKVGLEEVFFKKHIKEDISSFKNEKDDIFKQLFDREPNFFPQTINLIKELHGKYSLGVFSSMIKSNIEMILKKGEIMDLFDAVVGVDDIEKPKPSPEGYLKVIKRLRVKPKESVILEDSSSGIYAAKASGAKVIALLTTHSREELEEMEPDWIVEDLNELSIELVEKVGEQ